MRLGALELLDAFLSPDINADGIASDTSAARVAIASSLPRDSKKICVFFDICM